jgi:hypothetical protein
MSHPPSNQIPLLNLANSIFAHSKISPSESMISDKKSH